MKNSINISWYREQWRQIQNLLNAAEGDDLVQVIKNMIEHQDYFLNSDSIVASCNCLTKTPEIKYHKRGCKFRLIMERNTYKEELEHIRSYIHKKLKVGDKVKVQYGPRWVGTVYEGIIEKIRDKEDEWFEYPYIIRTGDRCHSYKLESILQKFNPKKDKYEDLQEM